MKIKRIVSNFILRELWIEIIKKCHLKSLHSYNNPKNHDNN